ncbi:MAG: hypothetical protein ACRDJN_01505, partial [Chloroflexota bacterium]
CKRRAVPSGDARGRRKVPGGHMVGRNAGGEVSPTQVYPAYIDASANGSVQCLERSSYGS